MCNHSSQAKAGGGLIQKLNKPLVNHHLLPIPDHHPVLIPGPSSLQVLSLLLARGARPDVCNHASQTPLMLASKSGRWACVSALLEAGANMLCFDLKHRRTCLHFAARGGHTECVRRILTAAQGGSIAGSW
jgi:ankyrin repeat protein